MGLRGAAIAQLDWCVGRLLDTLDRLDLTDNTLVILTSDNGPVLDDGYQDQANERVGDHRPAGPHRAGKYSAFEGGTRVPFIVRWPGQVAAGAVSSALLGQVDFPASLAALAGVRVPAGACPDSEDHLAALLGRTADGRRELVHQAQPMALRSGPWKFVPPGRTTDRLGPWTQVQIREPGLLFHLTDDPGETTDLAGQHPDRVAAMAARLAALRANSP